MDQRYENSDQWVYMNGELYHAGVKGMHWYQHLPGTDWWKVGKKYYQTYMNRNTTTTQKPGYQYVDGKMVPYESERKGPSKLQGIAKAAIITETASRQDMKR